MSSCRRTPHRRARRSRSGFDGWSHGGRRPLVLGGDHSITYPVLRGFAGRAEAPTVLHLDAHGDLYDEFPLRRRDGDAEGQLAIATRTPARSRA